MHHSTSQEPPSLFPAMRPRPIGPQSVGESYPYVRTSPTSRAAAASVTDAKVQRERIHAFIAGQGERGATREEIELHLQLSGNTVRPRCVELIAAGHLIETRVRRKTRAGRDAAVLRAAGVETVGKSEMETDP